MSALADGVVWLEHQLLDAPVQEFADDELVLRRAGDFVDPAELLGLPARAAEITQDLAIEIELVNAARIRVRAVEILRRSRRDADGPRRSGGLRAGHVGPRLVADRRTRIGGNRHIDGELLDEGAV